MIRHPLFNVINRGEKGTFSPPDKLIEEEIGRHEGT